jgi:hypothetical protein
LLIHAFKDRYLKRGSWHDREEFVRHVADSWPEYNEQVVPGKKGIALGPAL